MPAEKLTLVFFVDAVGWEVVRDSDCFSSVAPHRYRQRTVLGYSCAAQPTILTGRMPSEHGHWGMYYRSKRSEMKPLRAFGLVPSRISNHYRFRRQVLRWHRRQSGFTGYYHLYQIPWGLFGEFDLIEKRDIYATGAFVAAGTPGPARAPRAPLLVPSIFDELSERGIPWRSWSWKQSFDSIFAELEESFRAEERPAFAFLYTAYIDAFLHGHVGDAAAVAGAVRAVEEKVVHAVNAARAAYDQVDVLVFSDHGMAETTGSYDVMGAVARLGLAQERDYHVFYDSTMARFWFENPSAERAVRDALGALDCGDFLTDDDLRREGVHFEDRRFGEAVFLMRPAGLIVPSYMGRKAPRGMHGFTPDHRDSYAVLMSSFDVSPAPSHIRDSFAAMRKAAGLTP